jgi:hypothetical protein
MKNLHSILVLSMLSGCASVLSGGTQSVTVVTPNVEGANCSLTDSLGRIWYIKETPGSAVVRKGDGPITVICQKDGYAKATGLLKEKIAGASYGNLALGPAAPIGYFVDSLSGSTQKYNPVLEINLEKTQEKKPWNK